MILLTEWIKIQLLSCLRRYVDNVQHFVLKLGEVNFLTNTKSISVWQQEYTKIVERHTFLRENKYNYTKWTKISSVTESDIISKFLIG